MEPLKKIDLFSTLQPHFALSTTSLPYHLLTKLRIRNSPKLGSSERILFPKNFVQLWQSCKCTPNQGTRIESVQDRLLFVTKIIGTNFAFAKDEEWRKGWEMRIVFLWNGNQFLQKKKLMDPQHSWPQQLIGLIAIYQFFPIFIRIIVQVFWRKIMRGVRVYFVEQRVL